ncbi:hypothetical protein RclHR1_00240052 [Rhizophagus clarus]|uniref:BED-type domain-containing protein n=1 Tax=Rhizophagus clarus TaxID=94130 RepID=A0A2Z6RA40_9GLOM|nr:hypothetical protein RclHR1_00240052 [Rhizophagus clarus]
MTDSFLIEIVDESEEEIFSDIFVEDEFIFNLEDDQSIDKVTEITDRKAASTTSPVWQFFTRKEKTKKDQDGIEQTVRYIHCNIGECHLSANNSTSTLERHLKARHIDAYKKMHQ